MLLFILESLRTFDVSKDEGKVNRVNNWTELEKTWEKYLLIRLKRLKGFALCTSVRYAKYNKSLQDVLN